MPTAMGGSSFLRVSSFRGYPRAEMAISWSHPEPRVPQLWFGGYWSGGTAPRLPPDPPFLNNIRSRIERRISRSLSPVLVAVSTAKDLVAKLSARYPAARCIPAPCAAPALVSGRHHS